MPALHQELSSRQETPETLIGAEELLAQANDWDNIHQFIARKEVLRNPSKNKREYFNHIPHSPVLDKALVNEDWDSYFAEIKDFGFSLLDIKSLSLWVVDKFEHDDLESISRLYKRLAISKNYRQSNFSRPPRDTESASLINILDLCAFNLKEARDKKVSLYNRFLKKQKSENTEDVQSSHDTQPTNPKVVIDGDIVGAVRRDLSKKFLTLFSESGENYFPEIASRTISGITEENLHDRVSVMKDQSRAEALANISRSYEVEASLTLLASIDILEALAEATPLGKRDYVISIIADKYPEEFINLQTGGVLTEEEVIIGTKVLSVNHPRHFLFRFSEINCPRTILLEQIREAIANNDIVSTIENCLKSEVIAERCNDPEIQNILLEKIRSLYEENDHRRFLVFHFLYGEESLTVLRSGEYLSFIKTHADKVCSNFQERLSVLGDIRDQSFINSLADWSGGKKDRYRNIAQDFFKDYPDELRDMLLCMSFIDRRQSDDARYQVDENLYDISIKHFKSFGSHLKDMLISRCMDSWGVGIPSLSLISYIEPGSIPKEYIDEIADSIEYILGHIDESISSVYLVDDWGGEGGDGSYDDKKDYLFRKIADFTTLFPFLGRPHLTDMVVQIACRNIDMVHSLNNLKGDENYLGKVFSNEQIETIILSGTTLKFRIDALIAFDGCNEEMLDKAFRISAKEFEDLREFEDYKQFIKFTKLYYGYDLAKNGSADLVRLCQMLDERDWALVRKGGIENYTYERLSTHLVLVKALESVGISKEKAYAWANYASNLYEDPGFFYSLPSENRRSIVEVNKVLSSKRSDILRFILENSNVNMLDGAPKTLDILIGNDPESISSSIDLLCASFGMDQQRSQKMQDLFQLKDLRKGSFSRRFIFGNFMNLLGGEGGKELGNKLIESITLSKDDPKRLRTIFRLSDLVDINPIILEESDLKTARDRIVSSASEKVLTMIDLSPSEMEYVSVNIETAQGRGLLSAYISLSERYNTFGHEKSSQVIKDCYKHIMLGDFEEWRNQPLYENAEEFGGGSVEGWLTQATSSSAEAYLYSFEDMRNTTTEMLEDVYRHMPSRLAGFVGKGKTNHIKNKKGDQAADIKYINETLNAIESVKDFSTIDLKTVTSRCARTAKILDSLGARQSASDLRQIIKTLTRKVDTTKRVRYTSVDSSDPVDLINSGIYPQETCQSWRDGVFNECLASTVANPNTRILNMVDDQGTICGRSLIKKRFIQRQDIDKDDKRVGVGEPFEAVLLERVYSIRSDTVVRKLILQASINKAKACKLPLVVGSSYIRNEELKIIRSMGGKVLVSPISLDHEDVYGDAAYSDTFGGKIKHGDSNIPGGGYIITFDNDE